MFQPGYMLTFCLVISISTSLNLLCSHCHSDIVLT